MNVVANSTLTMTGDSERDFADEVWAGEFVGWGRGRSYTGTVLLHAGAVNVTGVGDGGGFYVSIGISGGGCGRAMTLVPDGELFGGWGF